MYVFHVFLSISVVGAHTHTCAHVTLTNHPPYTLTAFTPTSLLACKHAPGAKLNPAGYTSSQWRKSRFLFELVRPLHPPRPRRVCVCVLL